MKRMRVRVQEGFVIIRPDAENLHPPRIDEIGDRANQAVPLELPLVAMARWKREQRRSPMAEDGDTHVVAEAWGIPILMKGVHSELPAARFQLQRIATCDLRLANCELRTAN